MPRYRVFHLKQHRVCAFREAPPKQRPYRLMIRDYEEGVEIDAPSPYDAWKRMQDEGGEGGDARKLDVGDALQTETSSLMLLNFWGFDEAEWHFPEERSAPDRISDETAVVEGPAPPGSTPSS